ncbi:MAG: DUF4339 domain-containing protein [Burkholderiaceae bacterium]|nr:DUF4339 domain-containing protein [Burkholderiaceae bacterium]
MSETNWYYQNESGDQPVGPVSAEDLREKIAHGSIPRGRLLWRSGMAEWSAVENTELASALPADPPARQSTPLFTRPVGSASRRVPSPGEVTTVSSAPAWVLALLPVFVILLGLALSPLISERAAEAIGLGLSMGGYIGILRWDYGLLRLSGRPTPPRYLWFFLLVLFGPFATPFYLFQRIRQTGDAMGYFIASLVVAIFYLYMVVNVLMAVQAGAAG